MSAALCALLYLSCCAGHASGVPCAMLLCSAGQWRARSVLRCAVVRCGVLRSGVYCARCVLPMWHVPLCCLVLHCRNVLRCEVKRCAAKCVCVCARVATAAA